MKYLPDGDYLIVPDLQAPYHDKRTFRAFTSFVRDYQFRGAICVGDEADSPEPSRWNKGMAAEYAGTMEAGLIEAYDCMADICEAINGRPFYLSRSNHGDRIQKYISRYAPAMNTSWNKYDRIMGYNGHKPLLDGRTDPLPITYMEEPINFAKGWLVLHGDESSMIQSAGGTALSLARKTGASVICGHTHRAGMQHHNLAHSGKVTQSLVGIEVGHMMDMKKAGYLGFGGANWQQAFAVLHIHKGVVYPELVYIKDHKFTVGGQTYAGGR